MVVCMLPPASAAQPPQTHVASLVVGERAALEDSHGLPLQVNRAPPALFHKAQTAFDSDGERAYTGAVGVSAFSRACGFSHDNHTAYSIPRVFRTECVIQGVYTHNIQGLVAILR